MKANGLAGALALPFLGCQAPTGWNVTREVPELAQETR
jgi:hypothetical protein